LHDELGQNLALAKIKLDTLTGMKRSDDLAQGVRKVQQLLEYAIKKTRSLTVELSPPLLYDLGLQPAVQALCEEFRQQYRINFSFEDDGSDKGMDDDLRILLYQAIRELLVNVVKHSQASAARVAIARQGGAIRIVVEDNGVGFDTASADMRIGMAGGFGLFSIKERLKHLGGDIETDSRPGSGTKVTVQAPLDTP
jgi:signal transduction histidine kinase